MKYVGCDFETYGSRDLTKVGLDNYVNDPEFRPLLCGIEYDDGSQILLDFVCDEKTALDILRQTVDRVRKNNNLSFAAHNADFERRVLMRMGFDLSDVRFCDSAVVARLNGGDSHLENAAPQLLAADKLEVGKRLIQKFSMGEPPGPDVRLDPDWKLFGEYCVKDATLSRVLALTYNTSGQIREAQREAVTFRMNMAGWHVDLESVALMQERFLDNSIEAYTTFQQSFDPKRELNLNSTVQLTRWCRERGIISKSFDEEHVTELIVKIREKLPHTMNTNKYLGYWEVLQMLLTKQTLGGSSLKKLPVIQQLTGEDGRLRHSYVHAGAGASGRTTGRGVQMQNLKRLSDPSPMEGLKNQTEIWSNDVLASNIRQVFTATHPKGALIVGDFKSVEWVGLAFLAGDVAKVALFDNGLDPYKAAAANAYHVPLDQVTPFQRSLGKVAELSCGYGAGPVAVAAQGPKYGVDLTADAALDLVSTWRRLNPKTTALWATLQGLLTQALSEGIAGAPLGYGLRVVFSAISTPATLLKQHPDATSIVMELWKNEYRILQRTFHGCYLHGTEIQYFKPSERKTGQLWSATYTDKKTKRQAPHKLYGGKLAGILTQSFCREIFFNVLMRVDWWSSEHCRLIGQFHDEIVIDWSPESEISREQAERALDMFMSDPGIFTEFPLKADVKSSYRYIK